FLAKQLFKSGKFGLLAAIFLALMPAHFIQSRILLDNLFPIPFVLGWMLLLYLFVSKQKLIFLFLSALLLGIGIHSYHATKIMMPIYLIITIFVTLIKYKGRKVVVLIPLIAFILPLLPLISWLSKYPDTLTDQVRYTGLYDTRLSPIQGLMTLLKPEIISQRFGVYMRYFDPVFLFFKGDSSLIHSTGKIGIFLLPFIFLLPLGIYQALKNRNWFNILLVTGFLTAPFAASFVGNESRASKELFILPFASLLVTLAIKSLLEGNKKLKLLSLLLIIICFIQFGYFLSDYFGAYRARSYVWFDYDILGMQDTVLSLENTKPATAIYFDNRIYYYTDRYWKFDLIKHKRETLLQKTFFFDPLLENYASFRPNSIIVFRFDHTNNLVIQNSSLKLVKTILEPDNKVSFYIYKN
ncbi:glycosyltransferase family 39 protein, partial [Patescibacteria group bacterium]|nr:glycosyltransferase family 39 protein [Patescibacteria group bacterium]